MGKHILKGVLACVVFYLVGYFILVPIGSSIFVGDGVTLSYHLFTYMGLIALGGIIVTCTSIITNKINELLNELKIRNENDL